MIGCSSRLTVSSGISTITSDSSAFDFTSYISAYTHLSVYGLLLFYQVSNFIDVVASTASILLSVFIGYSETPFVNVVVNSFVRVV